MPHPSLSGVCGERQPELRHGAGAAGGRACTVFWVSLHSHKRHSTVLSGCGCACCHFIQPPAMQPTGARAGGRSGGCGGGVRGGADGTDAAAGRAEAKQARAALAALEWRVDKVRGGVLGGSGKALRLLPTILKAHVSSAVIRASALEAAARSSRQSKSLPACSDCCLPSPALPSHSPPMPPSARSRPWRPGRTRCAANCTL